MILTHMPSGSGGCTQRGDGPGWRREVRGHSPRNAERERESRMPGRREASWLELVKAYAHVRP